MGTGMAIGVGFNYVKPAVDKKSIVYGSHATELVVGSPGANADLALILNVLGIEKSK